MMGHEERVMERLEARVRSFHRNPNYFYSSESQADRRLIELAQAQLKYIQVLEAKAEVRGRDIDALSEARHRVKEAMQLI